MFVLAPFASLTLRMQGYAVGPGRGLTRRRGLPHRGVSQGSGFLVIGQAMCVLCWPYRCVLAVSCFYFGICPRGRHGIVRGSSWRLDLVLGLTLRTGVRGHLRGFSEVCLVV